MDCDHPRGYRRTSGCVGCERDEALASVTEMTHNAERREQEVERLRSAVAEVARWHTRDARMGHDDVRCMACQDEAWPCRTAIALGLDVTPSSVEVSDTLRCSHGTHEVAPLSCGGRHYGLPHYGPWCPTALVSR